jgi:hypothetical protein
MSNCSESELLALGEAGPLLRFAAEHIKNLDPDLSLAITEARAANDNNQWIPQVAARFWNAFSKLCDLIQPVTLDCLAAAHRNISPCRIISFVSSGQKVSLSERTSSRYLFVLFALFLIIVPLQLYVWTCTNISKEIDELVNSNLKTLQRVSEDYNKLQLVIQKNPDGTDHVLSVPESAAQDKFWADVAPIITDLNRINYDAYELKLISNGFLFAARESYEAIATPPK